MTTTERAKEWVQNWCSFGYISDDSDNRNSDLYREATELIPTLLEENEELKRQVVTSIENFHAVAKEWEAAERRVEELEGELRTLTNERDAARIEPDCSKSALIEPLEGKL